MTTDAGLCHLAKKKTNMHASFISGLNLLLALTDLKHHFSFFRWSIASASFCTHADLLALPSILHILDTGLPALTSSRRKKRTFTLQLFRLCVCVSVLLCVCVWQSVLHSTVSFYFLSKKRKRMLFISAAFQLMPFTRLCRMFARTLAHTKLGWLAQVWVALCMACWLGS